MELNSIKTKIVNQLLMQGLKLEDARLVAEDVINSMPAEMLAFVAGPDLDKLEAGINKDKMMFSAPVKGHAVSEAQVTKESQAECVSVFQTVLSEAYNRLLPDEFETLASMVKKVQDSIEEECKRSEGEHGLLTRIDDLMSMTSLLKTVQSRTQFLTGMTEVQDVLLELRSEVVKVCQDLRM
jgi:hypothetical protein